MKKLLLVLALVCASTSLAQAGRCQSRCREKARACKVRCKMKHKHLDDARHECLQTCELHEHECRSQC